MKHVAIYLTDDKYEILAKDVYERKMKGEKVTFNSILLRELEAYFVKSHIKQNANIEIEQKTVSEDAEQKTNEVAMRFDDIKFWANA